MESCSQQKFLELFQRVVHKYNQFEAQKRYYGTDILITVSEIHTIDAIGDNENLNLISLANLTGVTKGSASQMVYKLVDKGLVKKATAPYSDREIVLNLTEKGYAAYIGHKRMHEQSGSKINSIIKDMSPEILAVSLTYMERFEKELDKFLAEEE